MKIKNNNNLGPVPLSNKLVQGTGPGKNKAFTLIEIMIGILISTMVIIIGFNALNAIMVGRVKLIESTNIEKESFKFSQKFFEEIKRGGLIDYEEYFNRKVVGNSTYSSGHFLESTGFGNEGTTNGFYHCRSTNVNKMTGDGCLSVNLNDSGQNQNGKKQRYGQYSFQFIDYNVNHDSDGTIPGDEDGDGNIIGDDDDEYLGMGPEVFQSGSGATELYLISADKSKRTLFRWTVKTDPNGSSSGDCTSSDGGKTFTGSLCLGTIEFLKLEGKDWGFDHDITGGSTAGEYDGVNDTWIIDKDFSDGATVVAGSNTTNYRLPLFPNSINVKSFDIRAYPNKDIKLSWKENDIDLSPYVRINMTLAPSWKVKKAIKGKVPEFNISTTVNLTELFSR